MTLIGIKQSRKRKKKDFDSKECGQKGQLMEITDSEPPAQGFFFYGKKMPDIRYLSATREKLVQKIHHEG